eukprot:GFUD01081121.1.p1 GENE.GFUD01081121.1~~GFUD01081121.1.p1  ORF type:complete len:170 (-),score=30.54 GFUD01081121.1:6-515(-)
MEWLWIPATNPGKKKSKVTKSPFYFFMMSKKAEWKATGQWSERKMMEYLIWCTKLFLAGRVNRWRIQSLWLPSLICQDRAGQGAQGRGHQPQGQQGGDWGGPGHQVGKELMKSPLKTPGMTQVLVRPEKAKAVVLGNQQGDQQAEEAHDTGPHDTEEDLDHKDTNFLIL